MKYTIKELAIIIENCDNLEELERVKEFDMTHFTLEDYISFGYIFNKRKESLRLF